MQYYPLTLPLRISTHLANNPLQAFAGLLSLCVSEPVDAGGRQDLARLLRACPNLTSLGVLPSITTNTEAIGIFQISQDIAPRLAKYNGPMSIAWPVIPGRPISDVRITYTRWDSVTPAAQGGLRFLLGSTVPITTFHLEVIRWKDDFLSIIVERFPRLESLAIRCMEGEYKVSLRTAHSRLGMF